MADDAGVDGIPLQGRRLLKPITHLLQRLRKENIDRAGNRKLFYDQYAMLLLLYFFTPAMTSLRALQRTTEWESTQKKLGIVHTSLGSLSEAASVFDADPPRRVVQELAAQALPLTQGREAEALRGLTAVDGSVFAALPRMVWALWQDSAHRGVKLHLHFDVLKGVACDATITPAAGSETAELQAMLRAQRLYVLDRGYVSYELFAQLLAAGSSRERQHGLHAASRTTTRRRCSVSRRDPRRHHFAAGHFASQKLDQAAPATGDRRDHRPQRKARTALVADRSSRSVGRLGRVGVPASLER